MDVMFSFCYCFWVTHDSLKQIMERKKFLGLFNLVNGTKLYEPLYVKAFCGLLFWPKDMGIRSSYLRNY